MNYLISFAWGLLFLSCDPGVSLLILPAIIISEKGKSTECRALVVSSPAGLRRRGVQTYLQLLELNLLELNYPGVNLPSRILGIMAGLILSDAWVIFDSTRSKNALLGFGQSAAHAGDFDPSFLFYPIIALLTQ
jgi:hypothetical protein